MDKGIVCHLTTVHSPNDTRIVLKECRSLVDAGYEVNLVYVGLPMEPHSNINFVSVGEKYKSRLGRMLKGTWRVYKNALNIQADLYHFHDPELLFVGLLLKILGKKVIYDVHEDVPKQIMTKYWIPKDLRKIVASLTAYIEKNIVQFLDGVVAATPHIAEQFNHVSKFVVNVNNYPLLDELANNNDNMVESNNDSSVCYIGGITSIRGIKEMVNAISSTNVNLLLAGSFSPATLKKDVENLQGWKQVEFLNFLKRDEVKNVLARSKAGLVLFHPVPNHIDAQPNKLFEYMSAGIPVIASNFPKWKDIVERNNCGICVDPLDIKEIAEAINWIMDNPKDARKMGEDGRKAVETIYNWENEKKKLVSLYKELV